MTDTATTRNLADVLDERGPVDNTAVFDYLLNVREQAWDIIKSQLALKEDFACRDVEHIRDLKGEVCGNMHTYSGGSVDWVVRSWIGKPASGFTNLHLTCWLNGQTDVPNLGFALGTAPDVFCYVDLMPRTDIRVQPDYATKYLQPLNDRWIALRRDPDYKPFNPVHLYTRATLSPVAICGLLPFQTFKEKIEAVMLDYVRYWVDLVKNAPTARVEQQADLLTQTQVFRRTIVENDPANILADRMLGVPMRERLVRILWGAERDDS